MTTTRDQLIEVTCDLLEAQGYHATGLNQILTESHAPRGSLYHYFPGGKEELAAAAIARAGSILAERVRSGLAEIEGPAEAVRQFIRSIAAHVEASGFRGGGPLMTIALETVNTSSRLNHACRDAYGLLQAAFRDKLVHAGWAEQRADELATYITAAIEGGIILSRVGHSGNPLRLVADEIGSRLRQGARGE